MSDEKAPNSRSPESRPILEPEHMTKQKPTQRLCTMLGVFLCVSGFLVAVGMCFTAHCIPQKVQNSPESSQLPGLSESCHDMSLPVHYAEVVRPLFDNSTVFDLSATIWINAGDGLEYPVFDDIIVTGLTLASEEQSVIVPVTIPTEPL